MIADLPSPLLRSFVAVVEAGSLAAAAARVGRSESALSLQMARLEDVLGQPLFDRAGRGLRLNAAGARLLPHARAILGRIAAARQEMDLARVPPLRLGMVQDFVPGVLGPVLADLRAEAPGAAVSLVIGSTAELLQALGEDRIDTALCAGAPLGGQVAARLPMRWFGAAALAEAEIVPLLGITPPCPFLTAAQQALEAAGRPWRLALVTPSLDGLRAAVAAGLGLTCRTVPGMGLPALESPALPALHEISYAVMERRRGPSAAAARMAAHLAALVS